MTDHGHHRGRNNLHRKTVIIMRNTTSTISRRLRARSTTTMKALLGVGLVAGLLTGCSDAGDDVTEHSANAAATESSSDDDGDSREVLLAKAEFSQKTFLSPGDLVQGTDDPGPWFNKVSDGPDFEFTIDNLRTNTDTDGSSLVCYDIAGRNLGTYEQRLDEKNGAVAPEEDMAARWATAISDQMGDSSHIKSVGHDSYFMKSKITGAARVDVGHSDIAAYNANTGENSTTTINGGSFTTSICAKLKDKAIDNDAFTGIVVTYPEHYGYTAVKDGFKLDFSY